MQQVIQKISLRKFNEGGYLNNETGFSLLDKTALYWKKMSSKTLIAGEEMSVPGFKGQADSLVIG